MPSFLRSKKTTDLVYPDNVPLGCGITCTGWVMHKREREKRADRGPWACVCDRDRGGALGCIGELKAVKRIKLDDI
jgi:hypothetical protein